MLWAVTKREWDILPRTSIYGISALTPLFSTLRGIQRSDETRIIVSGSVNCSLNNLTILFFLLFLLIFLFTFSSQTKYTCNKEKVFVFYVLERKQTLGNLCLSVRLSVCAVLEDNIFSASLLCKLESAKNSLFQSVNEVLAVKTAKETMRLRSQPEKFGTVAPLRWTSIAHSHKHTHIYIYIYMYTDFP